MKIDEFVQEVKDYGLLTTLSEIDAEIAVNKKMKKNEAFEREYEKRFGKSGVSVDELYEKQYEAEDEEARVDAILNAGEAAREEF